MSSRITSFPLAGAFQPFTPRLVKINYVTIPSHPKVSLPNVNPASGGIGHDCGPDYPYDPRNKSLEGVFWNTFAVYNFICSGITKEIVVPPDTFYSTVSQNDADQLACQAAAAKAISAGADCAVCPLA